MNKEKKYAVRSSALDEDGIQYSFAGLQDTYLNVSYDDIADRVDECYRSQFSERANQYREKFRLESSKGMSVIVQEMVDADYAGGVIFTQNPMNNRIDEVVIEVVAGLGGEKLVSGHTTPSTYVIDKMNKNVKELRESRESMKGDLSQKFIEELLRYALMIEKVYSSPQDIEFAIADGSVFILQARPITTTVKVPEQVNEGLRFYLSFGHIQNMTYPITPVGGAEMLGRLLGFNNHPKAKGLVRYNGEFVFIDVTPLLITPPNFVFKKLSRMLSLINFDMPELALRYRQMNKNRRMLPLELVRLQMVLARGGIIKNFLSRSPSQAVPPLGIFEKHYERFLTYDKDELIGQSKGSLFTLFEAVLPYIGAGIIAFFRLRRLYERLGLDKSDLKVLESGLVGNVTTEMGLLYDDILLHYGTKEGDELLEVYIQKYGMRVDGEIDLAKIGPLIIQKHLKKK